MPKSSIRTEDLKQVVAAQKRRKALSAMAKVAQAPVSGPVYVESQFLQDLRAGLDVSAYLTEVDFQ